MKMIKVVKVEAYKKAYVKEIEQSLKALSAEVGGSIQAIYPYDDAVALICNDEGKMLGLPLNRALYTDDEMYDIVAGNFIIIGAVADNDGFSSLSDEQIEDYLAMYKRPEMFIRVGNGIKTIKM